MNRTNSRTRTTATATPKAASLATALLSLTLGSGTLFAQWTQIPPMFSPLSPSTVAKGSAATGPDGKIYVVGGLLPTYATSGNYRYEPLKTDNTYWPSIPSLNTPRWDHATVTGCDGRIYAIGGSNAAEHGGFNSLNSVETYFPGDPSWVQKSYSLWSSLSLQPRSHIVAAVGSDCKIYAFRASAWSGLEMAVFNSTNSFSGTSTWTLSTFPEILEPQVYGAVSSHDGKIYVHGASTMHVLTPPNTWVHTPMETVGLNARLESPSTLGVDGNIYVVGTDSGYPVGIQPSTLAVFGAGVNTFHGPDSMAATADGQVFGLGTWGQDSDYYGPLKANVGRPYKSWMSFDPNAGNFHGSTAPAPPLVPGRVGRAASFSGSSYVSMNPAYTDITSGDFTVEFWVNPASSASGTILDGRSQDTASGAYHGYHVVLYPGTFGGARVGFQMANGTFNDPAHIQTRYSRDSRDVQIVPGTWTHVAITVRRTPNGGKLWVNGVLADEFTPLNDNITSYLNGKLAAMRIGGHNFGAAYFKGLLDELTIYDRALSFQEVRSIFLAGAQGKALY